MKRVLSMGVLFLATMLCAKDTIKQEGWGVEINPFRLFASTDDESGWRSFSGTVSYFDNSSGVEIAMPILYSKDSTVRYSYGSFYDKQYESDEIALDVDIRYRKYFSQKRTEGAYIGAFVRYTYLDGRAKESAQYATVEKFGVGGELGFKIKDIFNTPFYWGASLSLGSYLGSDNDIFQTDAMSLGSFNMDDNQYIVDIEILKVGYEF